MTDQEIRIAVAECCGWTRGTKQESSFRDPSKKIQSDSWISPNGYPERKLPDYCEDLDAIQQAVDGLDSEKNTLTDDEGFATQRDRFIEVLEAIVSRNVCEEDIYYFTVNATARQRAEAFLRTLNNWKD